MKKDEGKVYPAGIRPIARDLWRVRIWYIDPATGASKEAQRRVRGSLAQAIALQDAERKRLGAPTPTPNRYRFQTYGDTWIESRKLRGARRTSIHHWNTVLLKHIFPTFGLMWIDAITAEDVENWLRAQAEIAKPVTVNYRLALLQTILRRWAKQRGLPPPPACSVEPLPVVADPDAPPNTMTPDELARILAWFEAKPFWRTFLFLGCVTGMRPGELLALTWADVDYDRGIITISKNLQRPMRGKPSQVGPPKNGKTRHAPLTPELANLLRGHRRWLIEHQHPGLGDGLGLVFPGWNGYLNHGSPGDQLRRATAALQLPHLSAKAMRRTFMDLSRLAGLSGLVTRAIAGHADARMTDTYSTVQRAELQEAGSRVVALARPDQKPDNG